MFSTLFNRIRFRLSGYFQPRMVYGFKRHDKVILKHTRVSNMTRIESPKLLDIQDNVYIGHFNFIDASGGLFIGEGCQIANYVSVLTHSSHIAIRLYGTNYLNHQNHVGYIKQASHIGAYTFIGSHVVLMPGVRLGKGTVVSAFSYVPAGHYPDFAILSGQPAKLVGDTRDLDQPLLDQHPELQPVYKAWADA